MTTSVDRQSYAPYRRGILTHGEMAMLTKLRPLIAFRDIALLWLQIIGAWIAVATWPHWWTVALAAPFIGTRYYALYIIAHDGLHRRLMDQVVRNDFWNDLLIIGAIGAVTRLNRGNHILHHRDLALPTDPDRYKYVAADRPDRLTCLLNLTGIPYLLRAVTNVFLVNRVGSPGAGDGYRPRDFAIVAGWQALLIAGLSLSIGWWAYPILWLLPIYVFTYTADIGRVFLEHSMPLSDDRADATQRLISYSSNFIERQFFAPMNMNFHAAHHLWPQIPYYNLPEADRLIRSSRYAADGLVWRESYLGYLASYLKNLSWRGNRRAAGLAGRA